MSKLTEEQLLDIRNRFNAFKHWRTVAKMEWDEGPMPDIEALLNHVDELQVEVAFHDRYRELVKSNLAEQSWKKDNERLQAELAEAHATIERVNNKAAEQLDEVRDQLTQTRAVLAVRTNGLLDFCYCEQLHPDTGGKCLACESIASNGAKELAVIRRAVDECERVILSLVDEGHSPTYAIESLAAIKKYFGGGGE